MAAIVTIALVVTAVPAMAAYKILNFTERGGSWCAASGGYAVQAPTWVNVGWLDPRCDYMRARVYQYLGGGVSGYVDGPWSATSSTAHVSPGWQFSGGAGKLNLKIQASAWLTIR